VRFYWLVIGILVTWRIAHLFYGEDGPWDIFVRLRRAAGEKFWGSLLDCFYCLSLWAALPLAIWVGENWRERLLLWPAMSTGAILLEMLTAKEEASSPIMQMQQQEEINDVLRQKANSDEDGAGKHRHTTQ
jgi:hypothetical protein